MPVEVKLALVLLAVAAGFSAFCAVVGFFSEYRRSRSLPDALRTLASVFAWTMVILVAAAVILYFVIWLLGVIFRA